MTEEKVTPLRQRMIEDMDIRGLCEKTQKAHIRNVKHFASFLGRPPDTATFGDFETDRLLRLALQNRRAFLDLA
jgi:integrase/recombinase XerD